MRAYIRAKWRLLCLVSFNFFRKTRDFNLKIREYQLDIPHWGIFSHTTGLQFLTNRAEGDFYRPTWHSAKQAKLISPKLSKQSGWQLGVGILYVHNVSPLTLVTGNSTCHPSYYM